MSSSSEVEKCLAAYAADQSPTAEIERAAVKALLAEAVKLAPGRSVELRIPPYAAVQVVEGTNHRRGTPSAVVEMTARSFIRLAVGEVSWADLKSAHLISASGERSDLGWLFPLDPSKPN